MIDKVAADQEASKRMVYRLATNGKLLAFELGSLGAPDMAILISLSERAMGSKI